MNQPLTPLYQDTVLHHLERAALWLHEAAAAPDLLKQYAEQVLRTGKTMAVEIVDAPSHSHGTLYWSLERVDLLTSLWANNVGLLAGGVMASARVLGGTAFFQGRAIGGGPNNYLDRRTKLGRRQMESYSRAHVLNGIADRMTLLPVDYSLTEDDGQMLNEWRSRLDASYRLYGLG